MTILIVRVVHQTSVRERNYPKYCAYRLVQWSPSLWNVALNKGADDERREWDSGEKQLYQEETVLRIILRNITDKGLLLLLCSIVLLVVVVMMMMHKMGLFNTHFAYCASLLATSKSTGQNHLIDFRRTYFIGKNFNILARGVESFKVTHTHLNGAPADWRDLILILL